MVSQNDRGLEYIQMVMAMILMGTVGVFVIESGQSAFNVVFFRCLFGAGFLVAYCYFCGYFKNTGLSVYTFLLIVISGIFLVFNWALLFQSYSYASISVSTVVYHTQPFFFVLIGVVLFGENITTNRAKRIICAFIGVVLVSKIGTETGEFQIEQLKGVMLALIAALFWAAATMIVKQLEGPKPQLILCIQVVIGIVVLLPFATIGEVSSASPLQWGYLIALGGIHTCLTYLLNYSAIKKLKTSAIAVLTFIYPVVAIIADYLVYGEVLSTLQLAGVVLILMSNYSRKSLHCLSNLKARTMATMQS